MTVAVEKAGVGNGAGGGARTKGPAEEKIYVTVRVRPLSNKELARSDTSDWECTNDNTIASKISVPDRSPYPSSYTFGKKRF
jgi:centromeric protein E